MTHNEHTAGNDFMKKFGGASGRCACGRAHTLPDVRITVAGGALAQLPALLAELGVRNPYLVMDGNTGQAAGNRAAQLLRGAGMACTVYSLPAVPKPQADMAELDQIAAQCQNGCDFVLGVGSGVINDLCKMLGKQTGLRTGIVGTAPSMDGYASNSSAMVVDGVKTTIYNRTPALVLCDPEVLKTAPVQMRGAGIGDMAAKAISIAEWKISHLVTGEYFCGAIAETMQGACRQAVDNAAAVMRGEARALQELTQGLILSGIASSMAQTSRPASGSEHTFSHLMDMHAIAHCQPHNLHGVQVGYGVRLALAAYEALLGLADIAAVAVPVPKRHNAAAWEQDMRRVFGAQADALLAAAQEGRNAPQALQARAAAAAANWPAIREILLGVVRRKQAILHALDTAGIPGLREPGRLGLTREDVLDTFLHAKDLRSRYIFPALVFDLGLLPWMRGYLLQALGMENDRPRYFDEA